MNELMLNFNIKEQEIKLFKLLDHVLEVSQKKFDKETSPNEDRQKWARIIISAVQAYGGLIEMRKLEEIEPEIKRTRR